MTPTPQPEEPLAWINGHLLPFSKASVPVWDLGVVAGASVSEMARTYRHKPFRLSVHLERLIESCKELGFDVPYSRKDLHDTAMHLADANRQLISDDDDLGIVFFVTAGSNSTYLAGQPGSSGTVCVHTFPLPFAQWKTAAKDGVRLSTVPRQQISGNSLPVHIKTRNRLHWWLADRAAEDKEPGSRALLLRHDGLITETSTACFYAVIDGTITTPGDDVLNSTTRLLVEELAATLDIPFAQGHLQPEDLSNATELFVSSTPSGLLPVRAVDGQVVGAEFPGSVLRQLWSAWADVSKVNTIEQILNHDL